MTPESDLLTRLLLAASKLGAKLWRNNCGTLQAKDGRYVTYGVGNPGGSDLIGYRPVVITPAMVGQTIAQFVALECKGPRGRVSPEQRQFVRVARQHGALAAIVWTEAPHRHQTGVVVETNERWELEDVELALTSKTHRE